MSLILSRPTLLGPPFTSATERTFRHGILGQTRTFEPCPECCDECFECPSWAQVRADNGDVLYLDMPGCANTPDPLPLTWNGAEYSYVGAWGFCADDFNPISLKCDCEGVYLGGDHGGNLFRVPVTIISLNPFLAEFTNETFPPSNEPCGGCDGEDGTITP